MSKDAEQQEAPAEMTYRDEDLVYVDPASRTVVGLVEWSNAGRPKALAMKDPVDEEQDVTAPPEEKPGARREKKRRKPVRVRYYPWGTYRSMKRVYKIEGKVIKEESNSTLDEVIEKALKEPFWD